MGTTQTTFSTKVIRGKDIMRDLEVSHNTAYAILKDIKKKYGVKRVTYNIYMDYICPTCVL
jgi:translation initiation factor 2 alpha subunit (eIF-2alpha)